MHAVPKMGPPGGPIFGTVFRFIFVKFFASGLKKRNVLVSTETLWLMATGKATVGHSFGSNPQFLDNPLPFTALAE